MSPATMWGIDSVAASEAWSLGKVEKTTRNVLSISSMTGVAHLTHNLEEYDLRKGTLAELQTVKRALCWEIEAAPEWLISHQHLPQLFGSLLSMLDKQKQNRLLGQVLHGERDHQEQEWQETCQAVI
nr:hypothetical protein Iba_chr11bCG9570 [Ipomoea batatas]